jgi:hypothetical protein
LTYDLGGINLANTSQSINYDMAIIKKYVPQMPRLKVVVLPVSYFSFRNDLKDTQEKWRTHFYKRFMGIDISTPPLDIKMWSNILLYSWPATQKFIIKGFIAETVNSMNEVGWQKPEEASRMTDQQKGKQRVMFHETLMREINFKFNEQHLSEALKILKEKGVKVLFVFMPTSPNYFQFTNSDVARMNADMVSNLCRFYGCASLDGQTLGFVQEDFVDEDHLNTQSSERFSKILNERINQLVKTP